MIANTKATEENVQRLASAAALLDEHDLHRYSLAIMPSNPGQAFLNACAALLLDRYRLEGK